MEKIQHSIEIEKPVQVVFSRAEDWTRWHYWFEGVSPFTMISGIEFRLPVPLIGPFIDRRLLKPQWDWIIRNSLKNFKELSKTDPN